METITTHAPFCQGSNWECLNDLGVVNNPFVIYNSGKLVGNGVEINCL